MISKLESKNICDLYVNQKISINNISKKLKVRPKIISDILKENSIEVKRHRNALDDKREELINLYKNGRIISDIAKYFGLCSASIIKYIKRINIPVRPLTRKPKYTLNETFFEKIDTEEKAYWLGFIYADGCVFIKNKSHSLIIGLSRKDRAHIELFRKSVQTDTPIADRIIGSRYINGNRLKPTEASDIKIYNVKFVKHLLNLGCTPRKSLTLEFPTEDQVPPRLVRHFIRGYFDGDGCICSVKPDVGTRRGYKIKFCGTKVFLQSLRDILIKSISLNKTKIYKNKNNKIHYLDYGGNRQVNKFCDWLYKDSTIYLDRKFLIFKQLELQNSK